LFRCNRCENERNNFEDFWDLSLALPTDQEECDVKSCLKNYLKLETLETESNCDNCKQMTGHSKRLKFEKMPTILMIHLKRFSNDGQKISKYVKISGDITIKSNKYSIISFISHWGRSSSSGHYINHSKHSGFWYKFNDESVSKFEDKLTSDDLTNAYILFYQISHQF
jgi:ubiquitin C-terminal hydrolase